MFNSQVFCLRQRWIKTWNRQTKKHKTTSSISNHLLSSCLGGGVFCCWNSITTTWLFWTGFLSWRWWEQGRCKWCQNGQRGCEGKLRERNLQRWKGKKWQQLELCASFRKFAKWGKKGRERGREYTAACMKETLVEKQEPAGIALSGFHSLPS